MGFGRIGMDHGQNRQQLRKHCRISTIECNGSSYIELPTELRNSKKGLINIKNKDNECFQWCHVWHLNPQEKDPQRIKRDDKQYVDKLNCNGIMFPVSQKQYQKSRNRTASKSMYLVTKKDSHTRFIFPNRHLKTK